MGHWANGVGSVNAWSAPIQQRSRGYTRPLQSQSKPVHTQNKAILALSKPSQAQSKPIQTPAQLEQPCQSQQQGVVANKTTRPCELSNVVVKKPCTRSDACQNTERVQEAETPKKESNVEESVVPHAGEEFISGLGMTLARWVTMSAEQKVPLGSFHCVCAPPIGVKGYLKRIHQYFQCSDECYVIALVILDRVGKKSPACTVCELNVHRLLVTAVMLAAKFHDDVYYSNAYYAKVGGLSLKELNSLEAKLLQLLDWNVNVSPEDYKQYHSIVLQAIRPRSCTQSPKKEPEPEP